MKINGFEPESRDVPGTPTIQMDDGKRPGANEFKYRPSKFKERQENFYRNLLRMRLLLNGCKTLPVYFEDDLGRRRKMDRGCIAIAVHDGFLRELEENSAGEVTHITFNW